MKVLIVDDNRDVARTTAFIFEALGCQAEVECDARRVLDKASEISPDLVIMDIGMPEINGYELCRTLRQKGLEKTFMVAHTGWGSEQDKIRAKEAGFDDVLVKPVSMQKYQQILEEHQRT